MTEKQIGVIGAGVMGEALICSLLDRGISSNSISVLEKRKVRKKFIRAKYSVETGPINNCQIVFIAVKPQDLISTLQQVSEQINKDALVISFVAGKTCSFIESYLSEGQRVMRVMPNMAMILKRGFLALSKGTYANDNDSLFVEDLLSSSGAIIVIDEQDQDAITALSGSGPAYFFLLTEAMAEAGERLGLDKTQSLLAAQQVLVGAAKLIEATEKGPRALREEVTSPNGTTQAALLKFEEQGFRELVYQAMKAAMDKSRELSN